MISSKWFSATHLLARLILGGVFLWAGVTKIVNPGQFAALIGNYQFFPPEVIPAIAVLLPWVEIVCGAMLVVNKLTAGGALIASALLAAFIGLHAISLVRGIDVVCGCLSLSEEAGSDIWLSIFRNTLLMGAGIWILFSRRHRSIETAP